MASGRGEKAELTACLCNRAQCQVEIYHLEDHSRSIPSSLTVFHACSYDERVEVVLSS